MPLPDGGDTQWPPKQFDEVFERIESWDAWYSGDPERLAKVYGGQTGAGFDTVSRARNRASQFSGGVRGKLARWFWGAPTLDGEPRTKLHIPLASDIASKSSRLLFAEPPQFTVKDTKDTKTQERLDDLLGDTIKAALMEAGEVAAGLGGVYLRVAWDTKIAKKPWLNAVHADAAVPEWRWGKLVACTFWRVLEKDGQKVIRHLERHEPGRILHGLYEGTEDKLGRKAPLNDHPETEALVGSLDDGDAILTLVEGLTVGYVPNVKPNRLWRKNPAASELGRADISGTEQVLDALDETWTSWMRDIRLAKGRVFVAQTYLQNNGPGQGAYFDADREIFSALNMLPQAGNNAPITISQFAIRVEEHSRSARELKGEILGACGYSLKTFGLTGDVAVTATEVISGERDSFSTRAHKILYWKPELASIVATLLEVDAVWFNSGVTPEEPTIEWPDGVATDPEAQARTLQLLDAAAAVSTRVKVEMLHPDWTSEQVDEEVDRIKPTLESPGDFTGGPIGIKGPQPPADDPPEEDPPAK